MILTPADIAAVVAARVFLGQLGAYVQPAAWQTGARHCDDDTWEVGLLCADDDPPLLRDEIPGWLLRSPRRECGVAR
jgi:hypothetical protein